MIGSTIIQLHSEIEPVDFIDVLWLGDDCKNIFSIYYFILRYDILCFHINKYSYYSPSSQEYELQGSSPHAFCVHDIEKPIHDHESTTTIQSFSPRSSTSNLFK